MSKLYLLPIAVYLLFQVTFLGTYIAAIVQGHVVPTIPYISDAATYSPESCVFGQLINMGCVLLGIVIYIRFRQICVLCDYHADLRDSTAKLNGRALWIGFGSCLGISIVANFQETNIHVIHLVGAFLCFGLGTVYFWIQAVISYYLQPYVGSMFKAHVRLFLSVVCTIFFIMVAVTGIISHILFRGEDPRKWYPSDGGWKYHVASSISEWIVATTFCFYILTFTDEFRSLSVDHPTIRILEYEILVDADLVRNSDSSPLAPSTPPPTPQNSVILL
ncbi:DNA damage-regulated autophagy modulator protein 1 isoform X1 [Phlebotomus argentipes]|uniref:DNA damage-regulated autophagy modulator protein 1 isoform X1 n=1 Tax=Phlebotomus argentipes TaxID=94469 RepID=UPI002892D272|nr:DNA damage-regulated autophagy modulator protein 1 isoform X1 [Phlebotomus argentipes]